jgi:hypothetical protein
MPQRMRDALIAVAVTGSLAGGTAVVAQAATSGGSSTTTTPSAAKTTPKPAPPARAKGAHPCPHMGSGSSASPNPGM